nr:putative ribonuclease H-like domain-containing protein [Tanacetum cinerariifolium]
MTGNISYLTDYEPYDRGYVSFGQGGCKITGKGIIKTGKLEFKHVYFVKDLKTPRQHNMYTIDLNNVVPHKDLTCLVAKASVDESMLWHRMIGHLNFKTMNKLVRHKLVRGLPTKCFENDHNCTACLKGKQHKASCKTKFTWTFFLKNKDETSGILRNFITEIENLKELKVKIIRCDNAGEFRNKEMNDFCLRKGTKEAAGQDVKKDVSSLRYIALPNWFHEAHLESSTSNAQDTYSADAPESSRNSNPTATSTNPPVDHIEILAVETPIPTVSSLVLTACLDVSPKPLSDIRLISKRVTSQDDTPSLDNILTLTNRFEDIIEVTTNTDDTNGVEADLSNMKEPKKISNALQDPSWVEAMQEELLQFKIHNVWSLVDCPKGVRPIGTKWVLKNKKDERGIVIINKARLVAQGNTHEERIDYNEVFAPIARIEAIRLFLAYASFIGFTVYQMDVKSAFLYGTIDEEVQRGDFILVQVYVDDIIFGSSNAQLCREFEALMHEKFQMSAMGELNFFLGLKVLQKKDGIFLSQDKHQVTPKECHLHAVKRTFRYLKGHPKLGLSYPKESPFDFVAYSDSDYGGASKDRKSTTGGSANGCGQVPWIQNQLLDYGDCFEKKLISVDHIHTDENVADLLTKPFDGGRFQYLVVKHAMYGFIIGNLIIYTTFVSHIVFGWVIGTSKYWGVLRILMISIRLIPLVSKAKTFDLVWIWLGGDYGNVFLMSFNGIQWIKTTNEGTKILATVDGKLRTISKSSIRRNLKLNDEVGISSLPDAELFENLTLMGYNILPNQKFTFQKGQFSHKWKYFIHTIMQCLSPKNNGFNEFSSNIATALVCLATNRVYNFSKMIFDDKPASPFVDDSQGEACPTDSGLEADQDRANITKTSTLPSDSTPKVTSFTADEGIMQHKLTELMNFCTRLQRQQPEMASKINAQELEISQLKARVKLLEDREGGGIAQSGENAPIKGRSLDEGQEAAKKGSDDTEEMITVLTSLDAATVLSSGVAEIPTGSGSIPTVGPPATRVSTSNDVVPTASPILTTTIESIPYTRRKGKEKMVESNTPKKKKLEEQIYVQLARELEEEMARDAQRMNEHIARDAEIVRIHTEEELQMMIDGLDRNNETVAKYLQEYHQFATELAIGRRIELISDLVKYQDNYAKVVKFQTQQRKPLFRKQQRDFYMSVLRSHAGWKAKHFKGMTLEEIKEKFDPISKQMQDFIPMGFKEEGERFKRKWLRVEKDSAKKVKTSEEVLEEKLKEMMQLIPVEEHLDREDLNQLWALIKETLNIRPAVNDKEKELWVELKRLYEPDVEELLWTHTQNLMHAQVE